MHDTMELEGSAGAQPARELLCPESDVGETRPGRYDAPSGGLPQWARGWATRGGLLRLFASLSLVCAALHVSLGRVRLPGGGAADASLADLVRLDSSHKDSQGHSLYCWAFTRGVGAEPLLLVKQMHHHWGIFSCDQHVVFSSRTRKIHGMHTIGLGHNPTPKKPKQDEAGNKYVLNSGIFKKAWRHIVKVKNYQRHDWVVKVDPDSVFFPGWLKQKLAQVSHRRAVMLYNIPKAWNEDGFRFYGPVEIVSRMAVDRLAEDGRKHPKQCLNIGEAQPEDGWAFHCFHHVLKVPGHFVHNLVHYKIAPNDFHKCNGGAVTFHAFKSPGPLVKCHNRAFSHGLHHR